VPVSLSGGASVDLTGTGGVLSGNSNATEINDQIQSAIGKIETSLTGSSSTAVHITEVQQVAPTNIDASSGTVTLDADTLGLSSTPSETTMVVVALPADLPADTKIIIPADIKNPVLVVSGTNSVQIYAGGNGDQSTIIYGNDADNIIYGDAGDTLVGGAGNDTIGALLGNSSVSGGGGANLIFGGSGADTLLGGVGDDTLVGSVLGSTAASDSIDGGAGNNLIISGGAGDDTMVGGAGDDTFVGGSGNDSVTTGDGSNQVLAGAGNDTVVGGAGIDNLQGGAGNDSLVGGAGNDVLWGGAGTDTLTGGAGADLFYVSGSGNATISDFSGSEGDQVDLVGITSLIVGTPSQATGTTASVALSSGNTVITMPDGSTITLVGIASLPDNSIIFG
jgi:Ca2+-binding RTX toxin-like protein